MNYTLSTDEQRRQLARHGTSTQPRRPDPSVRLPGAHVHDVVAMVGVSAEDVDPVQFLVVEQPQEAHFDRVVGVGAGQNAADAGNPRLGNIEIELLRQLELGQDAENGRSAACGAGGQAPAGAAPCWPYASPAGAALCWPYASPAGAALCWPYASPAGAALCMPYASPEGEANCASYSRA